MHSGPFDDDFEDGSESPEDEKRKKRNAVLDNRKLWPGAVVPYEISSVFGGMPKSLANTYMQNTRHDLNQPFLLDSIRPSSYLCYYASPHG